MKAVLKIQIQEHANVEGTMGEWFDKLKVAVQNASPETRITLNLNNGSRSVERTLKQRLKTLQVAKKQKG